MAEYSIIHVRGTMHSEHTFIVFYSLMSVDLHGRVVNLLKNMYSKLKSCILIDGSLSDVL